MIKLNSVQQDQTRFLNMVLLLVIKFWKKVKTGIEFVKHFRSHLGSIDGMAADADGMMLATASRYSVLTH